MHTINIISSFIASIMLAIMILFVLYKDWRDQVNRYYVFYNFGAFGILFNMFLTYAFPQYLSLTLVNKITQMSTVLFFGFLFNLSLVFPKREKKFPFIITFIVLLPALVVAAIAVFTDWTITKAYFNKNGELVREFQPFYTVYAIISYAYLLAGTINFIRKYIITKIEVYRLQMRYVFVGVSLAIILSTSCAIILPRVFNYTKLYVVGPSISSFIATVSLFYSVVAYRLMDIRSAIHKTVMYSIISMIIFVPIFGIIEMYDRNIFHLKDMPYYVLVAIIICFFILFTVFIQPAIDRLFKRKQYQFEGIVDGFIREIETIGTLQELIERSVEILVNSLYLQRAFLIMLSDVTRKYELLFYKGRNSDFTIAPLERNSSVIRWFVRNQEMLILDSIYRGEKELGDVREELLQFFIQNELQIVMPLYHEKRLAGLICIGEKESLAGFQPAELEKLGQFMQKNNEFISAALTQEQAMKEQLLSRTVELSSMLLSATMPQALPKLTSLRFGAFIVPKYAEGCDYFDFIRQSDQGIGLIITDVSGVGINSAIYSVLLRSGTLSSISDANATSTMMQNLNRLLYDYSRGKGGLVTAFYLYYDFKSMRLMYSNAGFPALEVFRIEKSNFDSLDAEGIPLGYDVTAAYGMGRTNLQKGDIGVLYTKTLINSKNQKGEEFGLLRLRSMISEYRMRSAAEIAELIKKTYLSFMGISTPYSDIVVLLFKAF